MWGKGDYFGASLSKLNYHTLWFLGLQIEKEGSKNTFKGLGILHLELKELILLCNDLFLVRIEIMRYVVVYSCFDTHIIPKFSKIPPNTNANPISLLILHRCQSSSPVTTASQPERICNLHRPTEHYIPKPSPSPSAL